LVAGTGIGTAGTALNTNVGTLAGLAGSGGVNVANAASLVIDRVGVTVLKVNADGSTSVVTDASQADVTTGAGGSILLSSAGTLTLNDGDGNGRSVSADGAGNARLSAGALLIANADVDSGSGNLTVLGTGDVALNGGASFRTGGAGTVDVEAGVAPGPLVGSITLSPLSVITSGTGDLRLVAVVNVTLGGLNTGGDASVIAITGSILNGGTAVNVAAAGLKLVSGGSGGAGTAAAPLGTSVATLTASAGSGGVFVTEADALVIGTVGVSVGKVNADGTITVVSDGAQSGVGTANSGSVVITTVAGSLTVNALGGAAVDASGTGNTRLQAAGAGTSVILNGEIEGNNVDVLGAQDVILNGTAMICSAGPGTVEV